MAHYMFNCGIINHPRIWKILKLWHCYFGTVKTSAKEPCSTSSSH